MLTIITDSSSELLKNEQKKYNIKVLPMPINFGETTYFSGEDLSNEDFYDKLKSAEKLPTTSMVNGFVFKTAFEEEIKKGNEVVAITISSHLSATYQQALKAASEVSKDKIFVVDSMNASLGQGALVIEAARLRKEGKSANEIFEIINNLKQKVRVFAMIDTLKYLKAGGRLSGTAAVIGTMLKVKPLVAIEDGKVLNKSKAIGIHNAFKQIISKLKSFDIDKSKCILTAHACDLKMNRDFLCAMSKGTKLKISGTVQIGSTIGVHIGPGAVAVSFFEK